jgi:hypothetical protein
LATIAPVAPVRSLRQGTRAAALRYARSCYDHLAGRLGVTITAALLEHQVFTAIDGIAATTRRPGDPLSAPLPTHPYQLGPAAPTVLAGLGIDLSALLHQPRSGRPLLRFCLDWTEQRHHLVGRLGASLLTTMCQAGWLTRRPGQRALRLTESGAAALGEHLGLDPNTAGADAHSSPGGRNITSVHRQRAEQRLGQHR